MAISKKLSQLASLTTVNGTAVTIAGTLNVPLADSPTFTGTVSGVTKAMVGLPNVEDKNSSTIRSELSHSNVSTALGFTPYNATNPNGYTTNVGTLTAVTATGPIASTGGTTPVISMPAATTAVDGHLTAADWTIFNNKQAAGTYATGTGTAAGTNTGDNAVNSLYSGLVTNATHTGDATGSGALTLATVNTNVGQFGSSTAIPVVTVNGKGLITAISTTSITVPTLVSQLTNDSSFATTTYVGTAIANLVASSPAALDTLNELAAALGNDASFATTTATNLGLKALKTTTISAGAGLTGGGDLGADRTLALTASGVAAGTYNNVTVDTYGRATSGSNVAYLTGYTESDTLATVTARGATTSTASTFSGGITGAINGMPYDGNGLSGMGVSTTWDARPQGIYDRYSLNWHTGISLSGYPGYGGVRLYASGYPSITTSTLRLEASDAVYTYGVLYNNGNTVLHAANYNSYSPTLTGGGASGTWGINITGSAASASTSTSATSANWSTYSQVQDTRAAPVLPNQYASHRTTYEFTDQIIGGWHSAITTMGWDSGSYAAWQIIGGATSSTHENWYLRSGIASSWNPLRTILHSSNYNSYAPTLTGTGASGTWGINVTGTAASETLATVTGRGATTATAISLSGTLSFAQPVGLSFANGQYIKDNGGGGLAIYSGAAINLTGATSVTGALTVSTTATASSLSLSNGFTLTAGASSYGQFSNWVYLPASHGFYSGVNSAHISPNESTSYGAWHISGTRNTWGGLSFAGNNGPVQLMVSPSSNETGFHTEGYGWQFRWSNGTLHCHKNSYGGGFDAIVLDSSNYNSYAPTLTGTGVSGTWGINVTGNSASATTLQTNGGVSFTTDNSGFHVINAEGTGSNLRLGAAWDKPGIYNGSGTTSGGAANSITIGSENSIYFVTQNVERGRFDNSGNGFATTSFRAPIFYDSDDTAYYVDPNSRSNINKLTLANSNEFLVLGNGDVSTTNQVGISWAGTTNPNYSIFKPAGAWIQPLHIAFHTGLKIGAQSAYGGTRFYNTELMATEIFSVGYNDNHVRVAEIGYAGNSFRAPIFYDSNDTAYYTDPASTSNLNVLTLAGNVSMGGSLTGATATPTRLYLGTNFSNGTTRNSLKICLYDDGGTEKYGFSVGAASDIQYHSNVAHDMYIANVLIATVKTLGLVMRGDIGSNSGNIFFCRPGVSAVEWGIQTNDVNFYIVNKTFTSYAYLNVPAAVWNFASDRRIKKDIVDLDYGLSTVMAMQPRRYTFIASDTVGLGFIAQELREVVPEAVDGVEREFLDTDTPQERATKTLAVGKETLIPVLVKAIQEQQAIIESLIARIAALEAK